MRLDNFKLAIDAHAHERYCQRVRLIDYQELEELIAEQLRTPGRRKRGYIQLDGIWWRYSIHDDTIRLHTCYGQHHMDLPEAIRWAKRYKDRISLGD